MNVAAKPETSRSRPAVAAAAWTWPERVGLLVGLVTAVRLVVASSVGLTDTEAYYAQWARFPDWSYYDHPPLIAWTTWALRHLSAQAWVVRVGPIAYSAAFSALLYRLGARLFSPRAGFLAVALLMAVPAYAAVGMMLNPEALLAPLWILFLLLLDDLREHDEAWRPLAVGAVIGVAFLAKYTAILAVPVAFAYVAAARSTRRWLSRPSFYLAGVVALAIATPVIAWNALHGWPSLRLHLADRMVRPATEGLAGALGRVLAGQLTDFHPLVFPAFLGLAAYGVVRARHDDRHRLLTIASLPVLAFLLFVMMRAGDSEPHWTMVAYAPLAVVAGGLLDGPAGRLRRVAEVGLRASLVVSALAAVVFLVHVRSPLFAQAVPSYEPDADPFNETLGWGPVRDAVTTHAAALGEGTVVAAAHNVLCGHLQGAVEDAPPVYCASARRTEFDFVGRRTPPADAPVVFVDSRRYPEQVAAVLPAHRCTQVQDVDVERGGRVVARYRIHACLPREVER
jgi:4-amino-4-deoxy-L-arabinose transferase-like glycosyltransferase